MCLFSRRLWSMASLTSPVLWPLTPSCSLWPSGQSQEPSRCILFVIIALKHMMYHKRVSAARWESNPPALVANKALLGMSVGLALETHRGKKDRLCQKFLRAHGSVMFYWSCSSPLGHNYNDSWCGNYSRAVSVCCFVVGFSLLVSGCSFFFFFSFLFWKKKILDI